jgi:hypothetical protein
VEDVDFLMIFVAENSNESQNTRFWKEKSVEDMVTLGPMAQATLLEIYKANRNQLKGYCCIF